VSETRLLPTRRIMAGPRTITAETRTARVARYNSNGKMKLMNMVKRRKPPGFVTGRREGTRYHERSTARGVRADPVRVPGSANVGTASECPLCWHTPEHRRSIVAHIS
jgi:hypothetical protein